ncbi:MAG: hypothetical protein KAU31_10650, partial [Spirochaetaceae bacterium]|nr:hypothetical protein [Spirochaetaceae bacterium]
MIEVRRDDAADLTIFEATYPVRAEDVMERIAAFYAGNPTRLVLWDFTGMDLASLSLDEVRAIANLAAGRGHDRSGGRTAIVASRNATFGLSRIFQSLLDTADPSVVTRVFRERSEA